MQRHRHWKRLLSSSAPAPPLLHLICRKNTQLTHYSTIITRHSDTIYAISSGQPTLGQPSAVCIIRISGLQATDTLRQMLLNRSAAASITPRRAHLRTLIDPRTGRPLDNALVLFFRGPNSFTGEDLVELHVHGSRAVVDGVCDALSQGLSFRMAEEGEFTRRAMMNGRMDLTQVEALSDLLHSDTDMQREQALRQLGGPRSDARQSSLSDVVHEWQEVIVHALAHLTAYIDFGDHSETIDSALTNYDEMALQIVPALWNDVMVPMAKELAIPLDALHPWQLGAVQHATGGGDCDAVGPNVGSMSRGEIIREGFRVVLVGEPNVGKSSLMNLLADREIAIVSDVAGTTRDVVEVRMNMSGYVVLMSDTAGIREIVASSSSLPSSSNANELDGHARIEMEGIRRSIERLKQAHLVLHIRDASNSADQPEGMLERVLREVVGTRNVPVMTIWNKTDLIPSESDEKRETMGPQGHNYDDHYISCTEKRGIDTLIHAITQQVKTKLSEGAEGDESGSYITRKRHRDCLYKCLQELCTVMHYMNQSKNYVLEAAKDMAQNGPMEKVVVSDDMTDMAMEHLRQAGYYMGIMLGQTDLEEILDIVFKEFCIGK